MSENLSRNILLRFIKITSVILAAIPFALAWHVYARGGLLFPDYMTGYILGIVVFMILFCLFGKIYEAFYISMNPIPEMIYSQSLAVFATDAVMYIFAWILRGEVPNLLPGIACLVAQIILAALWAYMAQHAYFFMFPAEKTAVIYDTNRNIADLIRQKKLEKKYDIKLDMPVAECIKDISVLDKMQTVFIAGVHSKERNIIMKYCVMRNINVVVVPRLGDIIMSSSVSSHLFHFPMLVINRYGASISYLFIKRTFDILISLMALVILSPIMLIVAIAIKLDDGGPIIYSQKRLTKDAKEFYIYKFRSMKVNAEQDGVARLSTGSNDTRVTNVGRILRKFRLDELPQLINILKGDLSIVGPRPERPEIAAEYEKDMPEFALRLTAKAGLTGYAQVYGQYNTAPYDKLQMDLMYIAHPSLIEDFKIIMATIKILFMSESTEGVSEGQVTASR